MNGLAWACASSLQAWIPGGMEGAVPPECDIPRWGSQEGTFFFFSYLENVVTSDCGLIPETSYFPNRLHGKGMSKRSGWGRVALDAVVQGFH